MPIRVKLRILDDKGNLEHEQDCHSWVLQYLQWLTAGFQGYFLSTQIKDITASMRTITSDIPRLDGVTGSNQKGIVVGLGTNVNAPADYQLQTLVAHGTGSNQLLHGTTSFIEPVVLSSSSAVTITRQFSNGGTNPVVIGEIGIYAFQGSYTFLFIRDKLDATISIGAGVTKTVQYTIAESN